MLSAIVATRTTAVDAAPSSGPPGSSASTTTRNRGTRAANRAAARAVKRTQVPASRTAVWDSTQAVKASGISLLRFMMPMILGAGSTYMTRHTIGFMPGEIGQVFDGELAWDDGVRVPIIVVGPGIESGTCRSSPLRPRAGPLPSRLFSTHRNT